MHTHRTAGAALAAAKETAVAIPPAKLQMSPWDLLSGVECRARGDGPLRPHMGEPAAPAEQAAAAAAGGGGS